MLLGGGNFDAAGPSGFSFRKRSEYKRKLVLRKDQGVAFVQPSPRIQWPDLIIVNGTDYTEQSAGSLIYKNTKGTILRFKDNL